MSESIKRPKVIAVAAAQTGGFGIGYQGRLPWKCPEDMAYFKKLTTGGVVLMGRVTADGFPKPLPKRVNLVLTRRDSYRDGFSTALDIGQALAVAQANQHEQLFVIGGAKVYEALAPYVDELHLTLITPRNILHPVDTYFPNHAYAADFQERERTVLSEEAVVHIYTRNPQ